MPLFSKGTASFRRMLGLGPVPNEIDIRKGLSEDQFRHFQDGLEEERMGWCDWRNPLLVPAAKDMPLLINDWAHLGFRIDSRKIPSSTLNAHVALRLSRMAKEQGLAFIGKEARTSIKDEIKMELLKKQPPVTKLIEVEWHLKSGVVLIGSTSKKVVEALTSMMIKSYGLQLLPMTPMLAAGKVAVDLQTDDIEALEPIALADSQAEGAMDVARSFLGQEFAMWLWRRGGGEGGQMVDSDDSAMFGDDSIQLAAEHGMAKNVALKKGAPADSEAAFKALLEGMKPTKIKMRLLKGDMEWVFGLNALSFDISSMKLPPVQGKSDVEIAADRNFLIEEALGMFDRRYSEFLHERMDSGAMTEVLTEWATNSLEEAKTAEPVE